MNYVPLYPIDYIPLIMSHYILSSWRNHLKSLHNFLPLSATPHPFAALRWHVGGPGHSDQPPLTIRCSKVWPVWPWAFRKGCSLKFLVNAGKYHENPMAYLKMLGNTTKIPFNMVKRLSFSPRKRPYISLKTAIHGFIYFWGETQVCCSHP